MISFQINIGVLGVNIWKVWIVKSINQSFRKSWMSVIFNQHLKEVSNQVKHFYIMLSTGEVFIWGKI